MKALSITPGNLEIFSFGKTPAERLSSTLLERSPLDSGKHLLSPQLPGKSLSFMRHTKESTKPWLDVDLSCNPKVQKFWNWNRSHLVRQPVWLLGFNGAFANIQPRDGHINLGMITSIILNRSHDYSGFSETSTGQHTLRRTAEDLEFPAYHPLFESRAIFWDKPSIEHIGQLCLHYSSAL